MTRLEANRQIISKIASAVEANPNMRFMQLLQNMNITKMNGLEVVDQWHEESEDTLATLLPMCGQS